MHGLINRSIQSFVTDTYGVAAWDSVAQRADLGFDGFEALLVYEDAVTQSVLAALVVELDRPLDGVLEDIGHYMVSHTHYEALRRLLRFGGVTFVDFLFSLDDLPDRTRLAVPDLSLPNIEVSDLGNGCFRLTCDATFEGFGHVMLGVLRAMADDYGDLVFLEHAGTKDGAEVVEVTLLETQFAEGRSFALSAEAG